MDDRLMEIDREVVKFLADHGIMPAFKDLDDKLEEVEERLTKKLRRMQVGLESKFLQAIRELGYIPNDPVKQLEIIQEIFGVTFKEMQEEIAMTGTEGAVIGRRFVESSLRSQGFRLSFSEFSQEALDVLRERTYVFCEDTFSRIRGDFAETLSEGYFHGKGIDDIAVDLRKDFSDLRDNRLKTIARTEVQSAQNEGAEITMREHNVEYKQWITAKDSRVRGRDPKDKANHVNLHGEVVRMDEPFSNGLMKPGDRRGPLDEFINCRCTMRPYIPKRGELIVTTPYYP